MLQINCQDKMLTLPWRETAALLEEAWQLASGGQQQTKVGGGRLDWAGGELGVVLDANKVWMI